MRYRVDFSNGSGYASYDESQYEKALELYHEMGIRLRLCKDIFDEGTVIDGPPIYEDISNVVYNAN